MHLRTSVFIENQKKKGNLFKITKVNKFNYLKGFICIKNKLKKTKIINDEKINLNFCCVTKNK